jgi:heme/copper-type cytochrome/quinol oxidase subunit 2
MNQLYDVLNSCLPQDYANKHSGEKNSDRNLKPQTPLSIFIAVVAFLRPLAATIYSYVQWERSGTFNPSTNLTLSSGYRYTADFFTPDAWNCQLEDYVASKSKSTRMENLCLEGTAARTMILAITVLGAIVLYGVAWRTYRRHQATQNSPKPVPCERELTVRSTTSDERTVIGDEKSEKVYEK